MKRFDGFLICTDLDGTLFMPGGTVSRQNLEAIEYFKSEGGRFTFITGRVPQTAGAVCKLIQPNAPYGCVNGGGIYDPREGRYLWCAYLAQGVSELIRAVDEQLPEIGFQLNTEAAIYFSKENPTMERFRRNTGVRNLSCRYEEVTEPILKVVFGHSENEQILALEALLKRHPLAGDFDFIRSEQTLYEILPKGVSKGNALCKMAELLGIDRKKTVAIGDYYNDISMLRAAGLGIAVANACPDARAAADHVTVSNMEHAIARVISDLERGAYGRG